MSPVYLTLPEIIDELRALTNAKETGTFFVVSDEQHSAMFGFENGLLVALQCRLRFGEKAIPLIAGIHKGKCRFDNALNFARRMDVTDNEEVFQAILSVKPQGGRKESVLPATPARPVSAAPVGKFALSLSPEQKEAINNILSEEMGPMANVVMDSIEDCADFDEMISVVYESADGLGVEELLVSKIRAVLNS
jgi:hypothetical protein